MPLFVALTSQQQLNDTLKEKIKTTLRHDCSPRHVPDEIIAVPEIPYTISGKKMETPVKEILKGVPLEKVVNKGAMRNPNSIDFFIAFAKNNKHLQQLHAY
jgi:acetoacetyl-CoA synthetase